MNNIFEGAKFGDKFVMQDGKIAIYYGIDKINGKHIIIGEGDPNYKYRYTDGRCFDTGVCEFDIISKYQEPIDEVKLINIAQELMDKYETDYINKIGRCNPEWLSHYYKGVKDGYHKAKEE